MLCQRREYDLNERAAVNTEVGLRMAQALLFKAKIYRLLYVKEKCTFSERKPSSLYFPLSCVACDRHCADFI